MKTENQTIVLEPSTNTHTMKGQVKITEKLENLGGLVIEANGTGVVLHGEHGTICTEEPDVIKLVQQEFNPITKMLQNSFD
jgi:hypothetical protein